MQRTARRLDTFLLFVRKAKKSNNNRLVRDAEKADGRLFPNWLVAINAGAHTYIIFI